MSRRMPRELWVLMPPEFEYLGGLFLPDLDRARLAARLAAAVGGWRAKGRAVHFDAGGHGLTARRTAELLAEQGAEAAVVVGGAHDRPGALILHRALLDAGLRCPPPLLVSAGEAVPRFLEERLRSSPRRPGPLPGSDGLTAGPPVTLFIAGRGARLLPPGPRFREGGGELMRVTAGRAGSIPAAIRRIVLLAPEEDPNRRLAGARGLQEGTALLALPLPGDPRSSAGGPAGWAARGAAVLRRSGEAAFRLAGLPGATATDDRQGGAAWATRYGLTSPRLRRLLFGLVSRHLPQWLGPLHAVSGFYELGTDPLEEMYAGNGLIDRNACLLENIV